MSPSPPLAAFRVVLVKPREPGNVGATARAVANFGMGELVLVAPAARRRYAGDGARSLLEHPMARAMAAGGAAALARARMVTGLPEALEGCVLAAAYTARAKLGGRSPARSPRDLAHTLLAAAARGPVALVFGPEDRGLTRAEVARCDLTVRIPTGDEYPVLNLAASVVVAGYELIAAAHEDRRATAASPASEPLATVAERERLASALGAALAAIDYPEARRAPGRARFERLAARAALTRSEYAFLLGFLQRLCASKEKGV